MHAIARRLCRHAAPLILAVLPMVAIAQQDRAGTSSEDAAARAGAGDREAGSPESIGHCVSLHTIRSTRVIDGRTIVFELTGNRMLVNRLPHNCPGLKFEKRFLYKTSLNQLCSQDIITVLTDYGRGASCGLGKFEVWVPPETSGAPPPGGTLEPAN